MHDIDRTQREFEMAMHELQPEHFEFSGESESYEGEVFEGAAFEGETFHEGYGEFPSHEMGYEGESYEGELYEGPLHEGELYEGEFHEAAMHETPSYEMGYEGESPLHEAEELELAAELLEITNEAELDQFLGRLVKRAWRGIRQVAPGVFRAVGGALKPLAKAALPIAGRALGTVVGGPLGGIVGGKLASAAGSLFGLELEGMSGEDREFEVARRYVRFAASAARNAALAPRNMNPRAVARASLIRAARRFAPGIAARRRRRPGYRYRYPYYAAPLLPWSYPPYGSPVQGCPCPAPGSAPPDAGYEPAPPPPPQANDGNSGGTDGAMSEEMGYMRNYGEPPIPSGARRRGSWFRRGHRIILLGV